MHGQTAPVAPSATTLAKYDKNKNGILDPDELAQKAADEAQNGNVVTLTPFEVSTARDRGYAAGNTLAGGRVDTPIAITPGSISVMTKEFMDDFNITNLNEAAAWTIGMDPGLTPNSDPFGANSYQTSFRGATNDSNFPQRNGSINYGVADSYNTERIEFNRGPDTSMFGDGGPGGRAGSTSKQARFSNTSTRAGLQADTYGGYRATLDFNKGYERGALRVNVLRQDNSGFQDDVHSKTNGITINTRVKLARNTTFIGEYERKNEWNQLWSKTLSDNAHLWDGATVNNNNTTIANATNLGVEQISANTDYLVWNFGTNSLLNYRGNQYRSRGLGYRIPFTNQFPYIPKFHPAIDESFNLAPESAAARDTGNFSYTLEHRIGNLFAQLGYWRNDYDVNTIWSNASVNEYRIDVNRVLPDGITPNPKFGKAYGETAQSNTYQQDYVREYKGLVTYRFAVPTFHDYKQQISSNFGYRKTRFEARGNSWRRSNNPTVPALTNAANTLRYRVYWDDPRAQLSSIFTDPNKLMPGYTFQYIDDNGNINKRSVKYLSLISQSAFFEEKLAITGSLRRDNIDGDFLPYFGSSGAPDYKNVLGYKAAGVHALRHQEPTQKSIGVVTYPFAKFSRWLSPIGFVYNFAQNNQQISSTLDPLYDGSEIPLTTSTTRDVGLRYSVPNGVAYVTVSHYNTEQRNSVFGMGNLGDMRTIWTNLGYTDPAKTSSSFSYSDLRSNKLEGWEFELTANPTPNLTLTANYSHPLNYTISDSEQKRMIYNDNIAEWTAGANAAAGSTLNGRTIGDPAAIRQAILNIENSLNGLTPGTLGNGSSRHRINLAGRYGIREGRFKGLAFNAGVNLRTHTKIGSRDAQLKFGVASPTAQQIKEAAYDYLWTGPTYSVSAGANYTRRFGKYNTRFQVNVTNLTDNQSPIWNGYSVITANQLLNGNPRMQVRTNFTQYDPRKFTFSTTIDL